VTVNGHEYSKAENRLLMSDPVITSAWHYNLSDKNEKNIQRTIQLVLSETISLGIQQHDQ